MVHISWESACCLSDLLYTASRYAPVTNEERRISVAVIHTLALSLLVRAPLRYVGIICHRRRMSLSERGMSGCEQSSREPSIEDPTRVPVQNGIQLSARLPSSWLKFCFSGMPTTFLHFDLLSRSDQPFQFELCKSTQAVAVRQARVWRDEPITGVAWLWPRPRLRFPPAPEFPPSKRRTRGSSLALLVLVRV